MVQYTINFKDNYLVVDSFGATVIKLNIQNKDILFLSENALFNNSKPIRGGIPIVFSNFGNSNNYDLPKHGFARIMHWKKIKEWRDSLNSGIIFELVSNEETYKYWDFNFKLIYTLTLDNKSLSSELRLQNIDKISFTYQCLFHNYFKINDIMNARISNLEYLEYIDQLTNLTNIHEEEIKIKDEVDRIYRPTHNSVILFENNKIKIKTDSDQCNFVIWNPWVRKSKSLSDFRDDEYEKMVCIEPGLLEEQIIDPWKIKTFTQTLFIIE